ncbi:GNAT family N-acetyltransferase [Streptomyces boluensis]|uniref:GNAT family N-acetyltransferase n=1 Tax=Streptomyces boluensis TaxID=1775135 RepID=A0A964XKW1_9ACTN|nr:GNAT family N-acetyltransferase [Streptomyces boluensis]NBE50963.1 GNAT family N-acetyltransferase [Streptomyces boluensis]
MPELQLLRPEHIPALLTFEQENRAYFARWVPDRGDDYFAEFAARLTALLAEQDAGVCFFHVLVEGDGAIVGRVNLIDAVDGAATLGYRIAERAAGRGLATTAVRQALGLAARSYGLRTVLAETTVVNAGSRAVLERTGFVRAGETTLDGLPALRFTRALAPEPVGAA